MKSVRFEHVEFKVPMEIQMEILPEIWDPGV